MRRVILACLAAAALAGCQERLTAPADCPALCPGGELELRDTVLTPSSDETFPDVGGYVDRGLGTSILVSNGLPAADARGIIRFVARADTVLVGEDWLPYTIDSISLSLGIAARDTMVDDLALLVYRLPVELADSAATFAEVEAQLVEANVIDTIPIPETIRTGAVTAVYTGAELARFAIPAADSGVLALALGLQSPAVTGVRVAGIAGGTIVPRFTTYATVDVEEEEEQDQTIVRAPAFTTWVAAAEPAAPPELLLVGGAPSKRVLLRFPFPDVLSDTAEVVRATLELTPAEPVIGLANDPAVLQVRAIFADFGAKSPPIPESGVAAGVAVLEVPIDTALSVDVTAIVRAWQQADSLPTAMLLDLQPEAATFTRLLLESTETGSPAAVPRLRITYSLPFDFETP